MTDEILSMMLFNDIHDCPMHPIRENNFVDYFKDKYPFNRDLGIDTTETGTNTYLDEFCTFITENHLETIHSQLTNPIYIDPLEELKKFQALDDFYNDENPESTSETPSESNLIIPQHLFYTFEETRKSQFTPTPSSTSKYTPAELTDKARYTFIHDKAIFDALNTALTHFNPRKETPRPWLPPSKASYSRNYTQSQILDLFSQAKTKVNSWILTCAGTRKIPPPVSESYMGEQLEGTLDMDRLSDEERLQQLREERLSLMLREIQDEDAKWNRFEACEIQIKLDLADMVLETLVEEVIEILG